MDRETTRIYRARLLGLRARLRDDVTQLAFAPDCEMTMQLWTKKEELLRKIEAALELIENGGYGRCQHCGRRILKARLTAVPHTDLCTACATRMANQPECHGRPRLSELGEVDDGQASAAFDRPPARSSARSRNPKDPVRGSSLRPGTKGVRRGKGVG